MAKRGDFSFPFNLNPGTGRISEEQYERHIQQLAKQVVLTAPGERVNLVEFGVNIRQLLFAPNSEVLATTTKFLIFQSLNRWLGDLITNIQVEVKAEEEKLLIDIDYVVRRTQAGQQTTVTISI